MEELRNKLFQLVNESGLPAEAIYYVVKDFYREIDETYKNYLQQVEIMKQQKQKQKEKGEE